MAIMISITPEISYYLDQAIEEQIDDGDDEAHKAYIQLMDQWFPWLIWELIKIINGVLKKLTA